MCLPEEVVMQYKMIVRQTMFGFSLRKNGKLKLCSVRFLRGSIMKKKGDRLLVSSDGRLEYFISGKTPVARLTGEQFCFAIQAARFFGCLPDQKNLPIWLWTESADLGKGFGISAPCLRQGREEACCS